MPVSFRARPTTQNEGSEPIHEYSSLQFNVTGRAAQIQHKLAEQIPEKDLAPDGRETEPHITARFGLHFQTPSLKLRTALKEFGPVNVTLGKTSLFTGDDADVVKVDVDSEDLHRLYKLIRRVVPVHTTHPTYRPHMTIAYVKPGKGKKYSGDAALAGTKLTFDSVTFSGRKGKRETLPLTSSRPVFRVR
jgi:hypothetical protein